MKTTTKKDVKIKYNLFLNKLVLNYDKYKKYLSNEDIEKLKNIDNQITELLLKIINKEIESAKK